MGLFDKLKSLVKTYETSTNREIHEASFREQLPDLTPTESTTKSIQPPKSLESLQGLTNLTGNQDAKRLREKETIMRLDKHAVSERYYLVEIGWMNRWLCYLKGGPSPGHITNSLIVDSDKKGLKRGLAFGEDFKVFNQYQWEYIQPIYGGGPALFTSSITPNTEAKRQYDVVMSRSPSNSSSRHSRTRSMFTSPLKYTLPILELTNEESQPNESIEDESEFKEDKSTDRIPPIIEEKDREDLSRRSTSKKRKDSTRVKIYKGIVGLENPELFCYLNTGIQMCISIESFRDYFLHQQYENIQNDKFKLFCCLFYKLMGAAFSRDKGVITPRPFWKFVTERFPKGRMHDLPEFLRYIFSQIETELHSDQKNIIRSLFEGTYESCITCNACKNLSKIIETFLDLPIELTPSILNSLKCFTNPELIINYECDKCKSKTSALKTMIFSHMPTHLILQIKRFKPTPFPHKLPNKIKFHKRLQLDK